MSDTCPYCGAALLVQDRFCPGCGQPTSLVGGSSPPGLPTSFLQAPTVRSAPSLAADDVSIPPPPPGYYIVYVPRDGPLPSSPPPPAPPTIEVPISPINTFIHRLFTDRRRRWFLLLPIVVVLVCIGAWVYELFFVSPASVLHQYCADLTAGNYQGIYDLYSMNYQTQIGEESAFATASEQADSSKGGVKSCTVGTVNQSGSSGDGIVTITYGNGSTASLDIQLDNNNNNGWQIDQIFSQ
jgi:hypothetical protein